MRIGILSLIPGHNYGGILQSFALQTVLENMGHESYVICKNIYQRTPGFFHSYIYVNRLLQLYRKQGSWKYALFPELSANHWYKSYRKNTEQFMDRYMNLRMVDDLSDINESDFDCIVVGSDQVWRPGFFEKQYVKPIDYAYLSFTDGWDIKRIAYAVSFGTDKWEYSQQQTDNCKKCLQSFDGISVREDSGIDHCNNYFDVCAEKVLDPTLLLTAEDYLSKIDLSKTQRSKGDLLVYVLDKSDELEKLITIVSQDKGLVPFITGEQTETLKNKKVVLPPLEEWLQGFVDAEFVITDSFHACVFSLIFHKPFIVIGNKGRGMTRFESLLKQFNLQDRMIIASDDYYALKDIDFTYANSVLDLYRNESMKFLQMI